jgi:DDE family transposase
MGYVGKKLVRELLRRGLTLFTSIRKDMKSLPLATSDKMLLNTVTGPRSSSAVSNNFLCSICPSTVCRSMPFFTSWLASPPIKSILLGPDSTFLQLIVLQSCLETHYWGYIMLTTAESSE